jgi:hypothetical protein
MVIIDINITEVHHIIKLVINGLTCGFNAQDIEYLFNIMGAKVPTAVLNRMRMELNIKSNAALP